jgi:hypothetical protein
MEESRFITFIRNNWLFLLLLLFVGIVIYLVSQYSFIQVNVQNSSSNQDITYQITDTKKDKSTSHTTTSNSYKKLVRRGEYEALATQDKSSAIAIVKSGGFFTTKQVDLILSIEKGRGFVGNNPFPCTIQSRQVLMTYQCDDFFSKAVAHVPATDEMPTYIARTNYPAPGRIAGTYYKGGQTYVLVHNDQGGDSGAAYILYELDGQKIFSKRELFDDRGERDYKLMPYRDGFILYDTQFRAFKYYSSPTAPAEDIKIDLPKMSKDMSAARIATTNDSIVLVIDDSAKRNDEDVHRDSASGNTIVGIYKNGKVQSYKFNITFSDIEACGTNKLCAVSDGMLYVYDISGSKAKLLYNVSGVQSVTRVGDQLIVQRNKQIIAFDPDTRTGSLDYTFGDYTSCGSPQATAPNQYVLCLINNRQKKVALLINRGTETDNIDQKVVELQKLSSVEDVSAYGNYLYVTPRLGPQIRDKTTGFYSSDPAVVRVTADEINKKLAEIGLDQQKYKVVNTAL